MTDATPILFLHGLGQQPPVWQPVITACAQRGLGSRWFAPWVPGLAPKDDRFDLATAVGTLATQFQLQTDGKPLDVVGVGPGGTVALGLAAEAPNLVRRVVAVAPPIKVGLLERTALKLLARQIPVASDSHRARLQRELRDLTRIDATQDLAKVAAPTLLLAGADDAAGRSSVAKTARRLSNATVATVSGRQSMQIENPEAFVDALAGFLADEA